MNQHACGTSSINHAHLTASDPQFNPSFGVQEQVQVQGPASNIDLTNADKVTRQPAMADCQGMSGTARARAKMLPRNQVVIKTGEQPQ